jgi:hypothetical protein
MLTSHSSASSRPRGFGVDRTNENELVQSAKKQTQTAVTKTPSAVATPGGKRRALGDISNRKGHVSSSVGPQKVVLQSQSVKQQRLVSFAPVPKTVTKKSMHQAVLPSVSTPHVRHTRTNIVSTPSVPPEVEVRAGRPFNPFEDDDEPINLSVDDLLMDDVCSPVAALHPRLFAYDFEGNDDIASLMIAPDELLMADDVGIIDLSLEEEVEALGVAITDISF